MSNENVVLFSRAVNANSELRKKLSAADATVAAWMRIAGEAGFSFSADEFNTVVEQTIGRKLTTNNAVREYLTARSVLGSADSVLGEEQLDQAVGGATTKEPYMFYKMSDVLISGY